MPQKGVAVTGANGHIGLQLIEQLLERDGDFQPIAIVRSARAAKALEQRFGERLQSRIVDYANANELGDALADATLCIHLVGIIRQTSNATYEDAHEKPCQAIVDAAQSLEHVVYLSIIGVGEPGMANNECLRSRDRAEQLLLNSSIPTSVLRVPMVLGLNDYASKALAAKASSAVRFELRPSSLEQPIDSSDVVTALIQLLSGPTQKSHLIELAGPESIPRRELVARAARVMGKRPGVMIGIPMWLGDFAASLLGVLPAPPVTRDMLQILNHDDAIDALAGAESLGISLTPLDETLRRVLTG